MARGPGRAFPFLAAAAGLLLLGGCAAADVESLYSLPRAPDAYASLQALLDQELASGSTYAAPTAGAWRQTVQQTDLDGDGTPEALAFFLGADGTPRILLYQKDAEGTFQPMGTIPGQGTAIGRVDYQDLDGDGMVEIVTAWQTSAQLRLLTVYSLAGGEPQLLLSADCTDFTLTDLAGGELMALRQDGHVDMYTFPAFGQPLCSTARLQDGIESLCRARTSPLEDGTAAFFVESLLDDGRCATDVFTLDQGLLTRLETGLEPRSCQVWAQDADAARCLEIPQAQALDGGLFRIQWYAPQRPSGAVLRRTTLHCFAHRWCLTLPAQTQELSVRCLAFTPEEHSWMLCTPGPDGQAEDRLAVFVFFGDERLARAEAEGRFLLSNDNGAAYAAQIFDSALSQESVEGAFSLIYPEWQTGAL